MDKQFYQKKPLRSRSMSFFNANDYLTNTKLPVKAVQIPRPTDFKECDKNKKLNIKNKQLNSACSSSNNQNKQISNWNNKNISIIISLKYY